MQIEVPALLQDEISAAPTGEASAAIAARVARIRELQLARQKSTNSGLSGADIDTFCAPDEKGAALLKSAMTRLGWSARAYHRVLKIARTIADLAAVPAVSSAHIAEAVAYRRGLARAQ